MIYRGKIIKIIKKLTFRKFTTINLLKNIESKYPPLKLQKYS